MKIIVIHISILTIRFQDVLLQTNLHKCMYIEGSIIFWALQNAKDSKLKTGKGKEGGIDT